MSKRISVGYFHVGPFCGERLLSPISWRRYPLFERNPSGSFSIGPILFWKEKI